MVEPDGKEDGMVPLPVVVEFGPPLPQFIMISNDTRRYIHKSCSPIDTSRVSIPNIVIRIRHRLAGVDIQVLNFKVEIYSARVLILFNVFPDHLSPDIVRSIGDLRS